MFSDMGLSTSVKFCSNLSIFCLLNLNKCNLTPIFITYKRITALNDIKICLMQRHRGSMQHGQCFFPVWMKLDITQSG